MKIPNTILKHSDGVSLAMYTIGAVGMLGAYLLNNLAGQKTGYEQAYLETGKTIDWDQKEANIVFKK